jgi:hypothetical protein
MSSLVVACPLCAAPLAVPDSMAGEAIACPVCQGQIRLPDAPAKNAAAEPSAPGDIPAVVTTTTSHRPRVPARSTGLPLGIILAWLATLGLVVLAGVMIWRERAARLTRASAVAARPVAPIGTEVKPEPQVKYKEVPPPQTPPDKPAEEKPPPAAPQPPEVKPAPKPKPAPPQVRPTPVAPAVASQDVWPLPPLIASSPAVLETLAADPSESCELTLRSTAANLPAKAAIFAEAEGSSAWTVWYVADLDAPEGKVPLATIRRAGRELTLAWMQPFADAGIRRQLVNCQVQWRDAASTRFIQFREKLSQSRLALDLTDDRQTLEFPLSDLPKPDHLRLEIRELARFPGGTTIRGDVKTLAVGKLAIVEFAEMPGAEIELWLLRQSASGNLVLRVEPVFKEKKIHEYALSLKNLSEVETKVKHSRDEDREKLSQAQANLQVARRNLATIEANPPPSESTPLQRNLYARARGTALSRIAEQDGKIRQLQEQIQRADARLQAVPKLRAFIQSSHGKASISYTLVAECGERDLVLVDGTRPL